MYVIIGAAVLPSREGRGLGRGTGLDGRPQWRREATNGRKIVMINLGYDCSNSNLKKKLSDGEVVLPPTSVCHS